VARARVRSPAARASGGQRRFGKEVGMDVVILCGGQGTRIRDVADDIPKPMIPIGGRPILWHNMKGFAHHGLDHFVLCLGYKAHTVKQYFLDYSLMTSDLTVRLGSGGVTVHRQPLEEDWHVTLADTGLDSMTGYRIRLIEKYIRGDTFLLTYGDGLCDIDVRKLIAFHRGHGRLATVTAVRPRGRFGEMELDGDRVVEFNEKPFTSRGWINGGFFVFDRKVFDYLPDDPGSVLEQGPLMGLAQDGELLAYQHHGFWQPMDTGRDHKYLNELWQQGLAEWRVWDAPLRRAAA
jgi:glucose-1-phosphate cytidylyltransferase